MKWDEINDVPDLVMEFLEYHSTVRGHSDRTVLAYYLDLKILLRFLKKRRRLVDRNCFGTVMLPGIVTGVELSCSKTQVYSLIRFVTHAEIPFLSF